jgi:hypothetical protein
MFGFAKILNLDPPCFDKICEVLNPAVVDVILIAVDLILRFTSFIWLIVSKRLRYLFFTFLFLTL